MIEFNIPKYNEKLNKEIIEEFRRGDKTRKDEFFQNNLRIVSTIINKNQKYIGLDAGIDENDLFQELSIKLYECIDRYDATKGSFTNFAYNSLSFIISNIFRDKCRGFALGRQLHEATLKVTKQIAILKEKGLPITPEGIAKDLNMKVELVREAIYTKPLGSLDFEIEDKGGNKVKVADLVPDNHNEFEDKMFKGDLEKALNLLTSRQKDAIIKMYFGGQTQREIARQMGISQCQVSRIMKKGMLKLGKLMKDYKDFSFN